MAHRVWATGEQGGSFEVGTDPADEAYIEVMGAPVIVSAVYGPVRYASGLDAAMASSPIIVIEVMGAGEGTWSFLADSEGATIRID